MATFNFMNEQVTTDASGAPLTTAKITGGTTDTSGAYVPSSLKTAAPVPYTPPNPAAPVQAETLNTSYTPPPAAGLSEPSPFVGSINDSLKFFQDLYLKEGEQREAEQKERDDLKGILKETFGKLNTYSDVYKDTESQMGIPKMYEDLNKLNVQMADLTGAYDKEYARTETKGIQSGTPAIFFQGEQAAIQRQKAVEVGALGIRQAAMVGNLDLANQRLEKTVELQFKPIENQIQQTLTFLELNWDDMNATERRQANTLQTALGFQSQQLAQQKEDRTNALQASVGTKFFKYPGSEQVYDTQTGQAVNYEQYIAKGGKADFSNITQFNPMETNQVLQLIADYPDAGIKPGMSLDQANALLPKSRIYQDKVRGPVGSGSGSGTLVGTNVTSTDAQVKQIIASKPGDGGWGDAYKAVADKFGTVVADKYNAVFDYVFRQGTSLDAAFNNAKLATPTTKLTDAQINTAVNSIANALDTEPNIKNYNVANQAYETLKKIGVDSKSPADDIAFIYAFAKIMDPDSVVREGEYNTIQKYAQSWADNFGFKAKRIFSNENFLSKDAKQKMLNTLAPKIQTLESQYNQTRNEYQRQIDDVYAGRPRTVTEYRPEESTINDPFGIR